MLCLFVFGQFMHDNPKSLLDWSLFLRKCNLFRTGSLHFHCQIQIDQLNDSLMMMQYHPLSFFDRTTRTPRLRGKMQLIQVLGHVFKNISLSLTLPLSLSLLLFFSLDPFNTLRICNFSLFGICAALHTT